MATFVKMLAVSFFLLLPLKVPLFAQEKTDQNQANSPTLESLAPVQPKYHYSYPLKDYKARESLAHLGWVYALTWIVYPLTQPDTVINKGSFSNYRKNFGQLVFDQDEPFWNWFVHPLSGSQLYLLYRSLGYDRQQAMGMGFISSTLFEFTVEIYTEPASVQDLYQTPVIGTILGIGIENLSLHLLNSGNSVSKFFGHLINPATLFWFYEGKVISTPIISKDKTGLLFMAEF